MKEMFVKFDADIHRRLKADDRGYEGSKPNPKDWADMMEEDPDFKEDFTRPFSNIDIPEADERRFGLWLVPSSDQRKARK